MPTIKQELVDEFIAKAQSVNATVVQLNEFADVLNYVVDTCEKKAPCEILADEDCPKGPKGPNDVPTRVTKIIAVPCLNDEDFAKMSETCKEKGFACIRDGLRNHLSGMDVGLSIAELGVAHSGSCLMNFDNENQRLAALVVEIAMIVLKKSEIYPDILSTIDRLRERMGTGTNKPTYTEFVTGPSRTADIERVSALGVHGPLELHILLLEA